MPPRYYTTFDRHQLNSIENIFTMPPLTLATMPHEVQYCSVLTKQLNGCETAKVYSMCM